MFSQLVHCQSYISVRECTYHFHRSEVLIESAKGRPVRSMRFACSLGRAAWSVVTRMQISYPVTANAGFPGARQSWITQLNANRSRCLLVVAATRFACVEKVCRFNGNLRERQRPLHGTGGAERMASIASSRCMSGAVAAQQMDIDGAGCRFERRGQLAPSGNHGHPLA